MKLISQFGVVNGNLGLVFQIRRVKRLPRIWAHGRDRGGQHTCVNFDPSSQIRVHPGNAKVRDPILHEREAHPTNAVTKASGLRKRDA